MASQESDVPARRSLGAYYTPADIAETLTRWALHRNAGPVLDPSYGICRFLDAALDALAVAGADNPERQVHGIDVDGDATASTTATLLARGARPSQFVHRDFFQVRPNPRFAAVLGNPPYVRHHWQDPVVKAAAERAMVNAGVPLSGLASLWAPFVVHAARFVRPGGRLAMLLPGAAIQAQYAGAVWDHLAGRYATVTLVRVGERAFVDALEETVVVLLDQRDDRGGRTPLTLDVSSFADLSRALTERPSIAELRKRGRRRERSRSNLTTRRLLDIATAHEDAARLGDVAEVRLGTVTGANAFFVRSSHDPLISGLDGADLARVVPSSRSLLGATWTDEDDARCVAEGKRCRMLQLSPGRRFAGPLKVALDRAEDEELNERSHCRRRSPWWAISPTPPPDAFLSYMCGTAKGIVHNAASANCINGVHRVTWVVPNGEAYVLSTWTSLWALSVEQCARHYAGGVLKLEPGIAPSLPVVRHTDPVARIELDSLLRNESLTTARAFADRLVLQGTLGFSPQQVRAVQTSLADLAARRSPPIRSMN